MTTTVYTKKGEAILVDDDIAPRLGCCYMGERYVMARFKNQASYTLLHRLIMSPPEGAFVDHKNGNTLDNRRENLRLATHAQNMHNRRRNAKSTSQYKGVSLHNQTGKWIVHIKIGPKVKHVGLFADETTAAEAYDQAAREAFGAFACVNFPLEGERSAA